MHDAEHRDAFAHQRDRDRRAAPPRGVLERSVVRVDEPYPAGLAPRGHRAFFAAELRREERLERGLQALLDLAVDRAAAALAARSLRRVELLAPPRALGLHR